MKSLKPPKQKKSGKRFPLLMYERVMGRFWIPSLLLGLQLIALWWFAGDGIVRDLYPPRDGIILGCGIFSLFFSAYTFFGRKMAYIRAYPSYFLISTPIFRLKTSYRRVVDMRPMDFIKLFPPEAVSGATRDVLEPFYPLTVLVITLNRYPMPLSILKLFLPPQMFYPQQSGFIIVVPDWMSVSTELDSFLGNYRQAARPTGEQKGFQRGLY